MSSKINILATGVTGYIGGTIIERFLNHPDAHKLKITVLVRSPEKAEKLKSLGVNPVIGSHNDAEKMRKLASEADIVLAMADCDDTEAAKAALQGLKDRFEATGKKPIYINTSGTGVIVEDSLGKCTYDKPYDDMDPDQIETLTPAHPHRPVDLLIVEADKQGYINSYIILPSTIYGIAKGRLVDLGIQNPHSIQIPGMIKAAIQHGQAKVVGEGKNTWNNVHIDDIADLYIRLYEALVTNPSSVGHGREGYFFGENGEYLMYDMVKAIAVALSARGIGTNEPVSFGPEGEVPPIRYMGTSSRAKGNRSRLLGWKPVHPAEDMIASIDAEVAAILKNLQK